MKSYFRKIIFFVALPLSWFLLLGASIYFLFYKPESDIVKIILISAAIFLTSIYFALMVYVLFSTWKKTRLLTTIDPKLLTQIFRANNNLIVTLNRDFTIAWTNNFDLLRKILNIHLSNQVFNQPIENLLGVTLATKFKKSYLLRASFKKTVDNVEKNFLVTSITKGLIVFHPNDLAERMKTHFFQNRTVFWILELDDQTSLALSSPQFEQNKSEILAFVTISLNEEFRKTEGIILSLTKGEFLIVLTQLMLKKFLKNEFDIIKKIKRQIFQKYKLDVSFSGGIFSDVSPIFNSEKKLDFYHFSHYHTLSKAVNAKQLAQSRGGDQIVVHSGVELKIYGKQQAPMKSMPDRFNIYKSFCKILKNYKKVLIVGHRNPDLDVFGAGIGLKRFIELYTPKTNCQVVSTSVAENIEKEVIQIIEKKNYLKNVVTKFNFKEWFQTSEKKLIILVDTGNPDFLDFPFKLVGKNNIAIFDHHNCQISNENIVFNYSTLEASSASELVLGFLIEWNRENKKLWPLYVSQILLAGILSDTNNLQSNVGQFTLGIINFFQEEKKLKLQKTIDQIKQFKVEREKVYKLDIEKFQRQSLSPDVIVLSRSLSNNSQFQAAAAAEFAATKFFPKSVIVILGGTHFSSSNIYVSIRSQNEVNAGLISEQLGGGGDQHRGAAQLTNTTINMTLSKIKKIVMEKNKK